VDFSEGLEVADIEHGGAIRAGLKERVALGDLRAGGGDGAFLGGFFPCLGDCFLLLIGGGFFFVFSFPGLRLRFFLRLGLLFPRFAFFFGGLLCLFLLLLIYGLVGSRDFFRGFLAGRELFR
jgi:hypothetical protein